MQNRQEQGAQWNQLLLHPYHDRGHSTFFSSSHTNNATIWKGYHELLPYTQNSKEQSSVWIAAHGVHQAVQDINASIDEFREELARKTGAVRRSIQALKAVIFAQEEWYLLPNLTRRSTVIFAMVAVAPADI